jgi:hypothetical protein
VRPGFADAAEATADLRERLAADIDPEAGGAIRTTRDFQRQRAPARMQHTTAAAADDPIIPLKP